ncbi:MAG: hypothetical protein QUS35_12275 [bacterium]|nr:hypothetical protein [bacterium]
MPIDYSMTIRRGILFVKARGRDDRLEDVEAYSRAVLAEAVASGCTKVICDETELVYSLNLVDTYELAEFISAHAPGVGRAAVVCNPGQIQDASFWENVAVNRGLQVRVFPDLNSAETWMEGAGSQPPP